MREQSFNLDLYYPHGYNLNKRVLSEWEQRPGRGQKREFVALISEEFNLALK